MQTMTWPQSPDPAVTRPGRACVVHWPEPGARGAERDARFIELLDGYRCSGGLARAGDVTAALRRHRAAHRAGVARWIERREVVHFDWQAETWLPLFQLGGFDMRPHAAVGRVIAEFAEPMPPWAVAQWFARPNIELAGRRPADALAADTLAVWQAARADRYRVDA